MRNQSPSPSATPSCIWGLWCRYRFDMKMKPQSKKDRWPITHLRWGRILALVIMLPLLSAYVGSYTYLSRRGMRQAERSGLKFFFYVPIDDPALRRNDLSRQGQLVTIYGPLNL